MSTPGWMVDMDRRARNLLLENGIRDEVVADGMSIEEYLAIPSIGKATILEVAATLRVEGFTELFDKLYWLKDPKCIAVIDLWIHKVRWHETYSAAMRLSKKRRAEASDCHAETSP